MKTTDTALLGHVSMNALSAAALSDLWTMCTAVLIQGRVLDILVGGAVGAGNPKLGGIYLQVAYAVIGVVAVFVFLAWNVTTQVWLAFGSDPQIAKLSGYYARILSLSIPGQLVFTQLSQYFSAQRIMHPEVNASAFALVCNLGFGLIFVLGVLPFPNNFDGFGFEACPIVTATVIYVQLLLFWYVYIHRQRLHKTCWDGWSPKDITWKRIKTFSGLYFPSAFGMASDFWRVAVIGAMAARLGEEEVAVFNTSYRYVLTFVCRKKAKLGARNVTWMVFLTKFQNYVDCLGPGHRHDRSKWYQYEYPSWSIGSSWRQTGWAGGCGHGRNFMFDRWRSCLGQHSSLWAYLYQ
jgi:MATE family multidrug resistance protein